MKKLFGVLLLFLISCSNPPAPQPTKPPVDEKQKLCKNVDERSDIVICDFGAVITIFGKGWGNSFRKIDIIPPSPTPTATPTKKETK